MGSSRWQRRQRRPRGDRAVHGPGVLLAAAAVAAALVPAAAIARAKPSKPAASASKSGESEHPPPKAKRYTLRQLVAHAREHYPGVEAARQAVEAMRQQLFRATWAWLPQGTVKSRLAPSPEMHCFNSAGERDSAECVTTTSKNINSFDIAGVHFRINAKLGSPLYTFGKISSAKRAATAGVRARVAQLGSAKGDIELQIVKAYWRLKLAREILYTVRKGREHLIKARKRIEKQLDEGKGEATLTDLLRLKTFTAEIDARTIEADKLAKVSLATLATLSGHRRHGFRIDTEIIAVLPGKLRDLDTYLQWGRTHRPEVDALRAAAAAQRAKRDLEFANFFPDFLLVAMVGYGSATSMDNPQNAFYNDPYNFFGAGFGLALNWKLDTVQQLGKYRAARAEALRIQAKRREGLVGIQIEIQKIYLELDEALKRMKITKKGQRAARSWLTATSQNLAAGLAKPQDLTDALVAYFQQRLRHIKAVSDVNIGWSKLARAIGRRAREPARQP